VTEVRVKAPAKAIAVIHLDAADITSVMLQDDILSSFTDEQIGKIAFVVNTEIQSRHPQPERTNAINPSQPK
jgi:hypothetical protein